MPGVFHRDIPKRTAGLSSPTTDAEIQQPVLHAICRSFSLKHVYTGFTVTTNASMRIRRTMVRMLSHRTRPRSPVIGAMLLII